MADLALIFHWSPASMDAMPLGELCGWGRRALELYEADLKARKGAGG